MYTNLKAIVFDLDDTLFKTREVRYEALKFAGKHFYDIEITDDSLNKHWGKPFLEFLSEVFEKVDEPKTISAKYRTVIKDFANQPYEDTLPTIEKLADSYKLGIVSAAAKFLVMEDLKGANFPIHKFIHIQSEDDTDAHKPDPAVFIPTISKMAEHKITPEHMLYLGDSIIDFQAATGAGLNFIGLADRTTPKEKFDQMGANSILSLSELPLILSGDISPFSSR